MAMQDASVNAIVIGEGLAILEARVTLKTDDGAFSMQRGVAGHTSVKV